MKKPKMIYRYYLDGQPIAGPRAIADAIGAPVETIRRRLVTGLMSWRGHSIEQEPADAPPDPDVRPIGLERWMARKDKIRNGGLMRREVRR